MTWVRLAVGLLAIVLFGGLNLFLFRRLVSDVTTSPWVKRGLSVALVATYAAVPILRLWGRNGNPPPTASLVVLAFWGLLLNVLLVLVGFEAVRWWMNRRAKKSAAGATPAAVTLGEAGGGARPVPALAVDDPERRRFLARVGAATALSVGGGLTTFGMYRALTAPETNEVPLRLPGLPKALEGFTIVQLSDLHVGPVLQERFVDLLVEEANRTKADLVAITGDLVDGSPQSLGTFVAKLRGLKSRHGIAFCSGNHDYYSGWERWAALLPDFGFTVLRNRFITIGDAGASFDLIGVEDWGMRGAGDYDLEAATAGRDPDRPSVLLAHQPANLEAVSDKHIGLQLSGHTHGGQLFPGTLISSLLWQERSTGLSRQGNTWLYTSRGCGFVGPPMRIGSPPEIVKLVLTSG